MFPNSHKKPFYYKQQCSSCMLCLITSLVCVHHLAPSFDATWVGPRNSRNAKQKREKRPIYPHILAVIFLVAFVFKIVQAIPYESSMVVVENQIKARAAFPRLDVGFVMPMLMKQTTSCANSWSRRVSSIHCPTTTTTLP